jgi:hypothetical protein
VQPGWDEAGRLPLKKRLGISNGIACLIGTTP